MCKTKGCESDRKSIRRAQLKGDFYSFLKRLEPLKGLFEVARAMFRNIWAMKLSRAGEERKELQAKIREPDGQIERLLDRIVEAQSATVACKLEERVTLLEREKLLLAERIADAGKPRHTAQESFELATRFLSSPCKVWEKMDA